MAVTRLKRKALRNKAKAAQRKAAMKRLLSTPVIKRVMPADLAQANPQSVG